MVADFNNPLSIIDNIQRETAEYTLFSSAHGIFTKTDNIVGHKTSQ